LPLPDAVTQPRSRASRRPGLLPLGWALLCIGAVAFDALEAFAALAVAGHPVPTEAIGDALADAYNALHDEELSLFPDAHETCRAENRPLDGWGHQRSQSRPEP
jgi:hypothetical protein